MTLALPDGDDLVDLVHDADHVALVDLSDVATCAARRRGRGCALPVLHDGQHDDGERTWRRSGPDQRRRDALVVVVERLRQEVAEPLSV
ncbi:hypothetical protein FHN55_00145 [Streptomyces sp. NP160]|uniref:hypothetical protein n=1 Tax=Streptomyces sp. NP160 TaxID=2586637 RepID=UPI00111B09B6|nr:hypothetical protein [Streptomyces sp. NP160]TNM70472.1 hypothetical protein FHN55_00145 [Streptomyces sp. NP160]